MLRPVTGPDCRARINGILATFAQTRDAQVRKADARIERYCEEERQIARMGTERMWPME